MVANNAGMPATPADLINVDEVIGKYYDLVPDPSVAEQRVSFGTSGHRGSSLKTSFNEAHIVAITQANQNSLARLADYPLYIPSEEQEFRVGAMTSRTSGHLLLDLLYLGVAKHSPERTEENLHKTRELIRTLQSK